MNLIDVCCGALIILGSIPLGLAIISFTQGHTIAGCTYVFTSLFLFAAGNSNWTSSPNHGGTQ